MKTVSRRDLHLALSSFLLSGTAMPGHGLAEPEKSKTLSDSEVFSLDRIPVTTNPAGGKRWDILEGLLATGEAVAVHESLQPAGIAPNPPHTIQHSELILVQEGTLLLEYDARSEKLGLGGVIFVALGTKHTARNVGDGPARYLVIAIGGDTK